jgi:RNA-binding protein 23/39
MELVQRPLRVGLGSERFGGSESDRSMLQRSANPSSMQGSSLFGAGGRGHHAGGSANFDRAGGRNNDKGAGGASALDDTDVAGVNFNRDKLMRQLAREPEAPKTTTTTKATSTAPSALRVPASRHIKISNAFNTAK